MEDVLTFKIKGHWTRDKQYILPLVFDRFLLMHKFKCYRIDWFPCDGNNIIEDKITVRLYINK